MSVQVGDLAWIRAKAGLKLSDDEVWFTDLQGIPIKNTDGECIPDVPGLAALAAVVAEVGAERITEALADAVVGLGFDAVKAMDQGLSSLAKDYTSNADILRRLAAALEVK